MSNQPPHLSLSEAVALACTSGPQLRLRRLGGVLEIESHEDARSIRTRCMSDGPDFDTVVYANRMRECLSGIGGSATLTHGKKGLKIQGSSGLVLVPTVTDASWRPDFDCAPTDAVKMDGDAFRVAVERVRPAMGDSAKEPRTHGVLLTADGHTVALDGHAMFLAPAPPGIRLYIPGQCIPSILGMKDAELTVAIVGHRLSVSSATTTFTSSLTSEQPVCDNYDRVLASITPDAELVVPREAFLRAINVAKIAKATYVMLTSGKDRLFMSAKGTDGGMAESGCASTGKIHRVYTSPLLLESAAKMLIGEQIAIKTMSPNKGAASTTYSILMTGADGAVAMVQPGVPREGEE